MTLNELAEAMDAQIARLQSIRAIVATLLPAGTDSTVELSEITFLSGSEKPALRTATLPEADASSDEPADEPRRRKLPVPRERRRRESGAKRPATRRRELPPTALGGAVPQGPIVVSAADVRARPVVDVKPAARSVATPSSGHSLDDLVRQLTHRAEPGLRDTIANSSDR